MELAPVFQRDMLIVDQVTFPTQQTQQSVSYNTGSMTGTAAWPICMSLQDM